MPLRREISYLEMIPPWYGLAYRQVHMDSIVCYPIPLNVVARVWMNVRTWFKVPFRNPISYERALVVAFQRGEEKGRRLENRARREGFDDGWEMCIQTLTTLWKQHLRDGAGDGRSPSDEAEATLSTQLDSTSLEDAPDALRPSVPPAPASEEVNGHGKG